MILWLRPGQLGRAKWTVEMHNDACLGCRAYADEINRIRAALHNITPGVYDENPVSAVISFVRDFRTLVVSSVTMGRSVVSAWLSAVRKMGINVDDVVTVPKSTDL